MKHLLSRPLVPLASALIALAAAGQAMAQTSSVHIDMTGSIRKATCDMKAGDLDRTVVLPDVPQWAFRDQPSAGTTDFSLTASGCGPLDHASFRFSGTADPGDAWRFQNTGDAKGVALWLQFAGKTLCNDGAGCAGGAKVPVVLNLGTGTVNVQASYFKVGSAVTAGSFMSQVTVEMDYE